jgi:hypothetical protein
MWKGIVIALLVGAGSYCGYLAYTGQLVPTLQAGRNWVERQVGIKQGKTDLKATPYPAYGPVIAPGQ